MNVIKSNTNRILITFIGLGVRSKGYEPTRYFIYPDKANTSSSRTAGIAIANLMKSYNTIIALVTNESEEFVPSYEKELLKKCKFIPYKVSKEINSEDVLGIAGDLVKIIENIQLKNEDPLIVDIDITHGFRHLPLLYFAAMSFLSTFRGVTLDKIYYGLYEYELPLTPIINIGMAFNFIIWSQAVNSFLEIGRVDMLTSLLKNLRMDYQYSEDTSRKLHEIEKALRGLILPLSHALPLEIGKCAGSLLDRIQDMNESSSLSPALTYLFSEISNELRPLCSAGGPKEDYSLTDMELERQFAIIEWFFQRGRIGDALLLLREYFVNAMMLNSPESWLDTKARQAVDRKLSALASIMTDNDLKGLLTGDQQELAKYWDMLRQLRNFYAHAGFTRIEIRPDTQRKQMKDIISFCKKLQPVSLDIHQSGGRLLICPLGLTKGSLYTALVKKQPDSLLVITSDTSKNYLDEILAKTDFSKDKTHVVVLKDPFIGFAEIKKIIKKTKVHLASANTVLACVTGGTTLMGEVVRELVASSTSIGVPCSIFATVDRRSVDEQRENPFAEGEILALDIKLERQGEEA